MRFVCISRRFSLYPDKVECNLFSDIEIGLRIENCQEKRKQQINNFYLRQCSCRMESPTLMTN